MPNKAEDILADANKLASLILMEQGYMFPKGQKHYEAGARPEEKQAWEATRIAYMHFRATDLEDVLSDTGY